MTNMSAENLEKINPSDHRRRGRPRKSSSTRLAEPPKKVTTVRKFEPENPSADKPPPSRKPLSDMRSPRHTNTCRRVLRIGHMAWDGRSATEIADEIGVSVPHVYHLCSFYRIRLVAKTRAQYAFRTMVHKDTMPALEFIARQRGEDVTTMVERLLDALANEPTLVSNLLDDDE